MNHNKSSSEYYFKEGCFITELSNVETDADVSIARVRVEAGVTTVWHRLIDTTERYVILQGTGLMEVAGQSNRAVSVDDVVLIEAGLAQRITNTGDSDLLFLAICSPRFTPDCYKEVNSR